MAVFGVLSLKLHVYINENMNELELSIVKWKSS